MRAIVARIHRIQLIVDFTVSSNAEDGQSSVPMISISSTNHRGSSQNQPAKQGSIKQLAVNIFSHSMTTTQYIIFFILL
jgi:hypothetical protein